MILCVFMGEGGGGDHGMKILKILIPCLFFLELREYGKILKVYFSNSETR